MNKIAHMFVDPDDVVIETIGDEHILCLNRGYDYERSFSFLRIDVDVFTHDGEILMSFNNPSQFESFFDFKSVYLEIHEIDGAAVANVELHYR